MKKFTPLLAVAVLAIGSLSASSAFAQGFSNGGYGGNWTPRNPGVQWGNQAGMTYNQGSNWGRQSNTNWNVQQGTVYQNQGQALIGGILSGIGGGLSNNPRNGTASGILTGIGANMMNTSGRHDYSQGNITNTQTGYNNQFGGAQIFNGGYRQPYQQNIYRRW
jgi:hypothetical protein